MKKNIYRLINKNRKAIILKSIRHYCTSYLNAYYNLNNNDHNSNGEFWLQKRVAPFCGGVVFDVGANVGKWTMCAREFFKDSTIYAFEAIGPTYEVLASNVKPNKVFLVNKGLSDENQQVEFFYYPNKSIFSSRFNTRVSNDFIKLKVDLVRGDDFCSENDIKNIDFLKIDTEGSDFSVLKGFESFLKSINIRIIQFEYAQINFQTRILLRDFYVLLESFGYIIGKLHSNHVEFGPYTSLEEKFCGLNYIAVRKNDIELIHALS